MKEKMKLSGIPETMLQTLYARSKESIGRKAIYDEKAVELISNISYDFSLADKDKPMHDGVIARTIVLDKLTADFLTMHENTVVVNIGCGLDTRCYRFENYKYWYNLDLPETIAVRQRLLVEDGKIGQIAMSAMDDWSEKITEKGENALVIIEGLTMYLSRDDVKKIFAIIAKCFAKVTVFVEIMNSYVVKTVKEKSIEGSHAKFSWGIKNGKELEKILPDFKYKEEHSLVEGMEQFIPVYKLLAKIPAVKNISNKIVVVEKERLL